ncbi:MAG: hypothetical protein RL076_1241 [Chloroflexota bacterium]
MLSRWVDASAHKLGSEWHDARNVPYVVDFSPPSASEVNTIGGMDQWLTRQGRLSATQPKAGVTGRNRVLIIRVHFSNATQRLTNAQLTTNWLTPLNNHFRTMSNGRNDGWDFDFYGPVNVDSRSTYVRPNNEMSDDDEDNAQDLVDDVVDASDESVLEPLLERADTVILLMDNQYQARLRGVNYWNKLDYDFGFFDLGDDIVTIFMDEGGTCDCTSAALDTYMWGVMAHELGHSLQAFKGGVHQQIEYAHPSNYRNGFELLDAAYPGHVSAYLKTFTMEEWLPDPLIIDISNTGTQKPSDMGYCLRAIEYDPAVYPTPQILRIRITGSVYYLVSAHRRVNGDELAPIPDEGILIERIVADGMTQWEDLYRGDPAVRNGVIDADEVIQQKSVVRGFANSGGLADLNKLWSVGKTFNNTTDGLITGDATDGITIEVLGTQPNPDTWCVRVRYGAAANQPDVGIYPWRQPPGETYETTDIWVDSPLNGYGVFRYGTWNDLTGLPVPRGNGDDPAIGSVNRLFARVRNFGTTNAVDVKVQFKVTNPLGVGVQNSSWSNVGALVTSAQFPSLATIPPGGYVDVYTEWTPNPTLTSEQIAAGVFSFHSCIRVEIATVAGETITSNQDGVDEQENIRNFEATPTRSPIFEHVFDLINTEARNRLINIFDDGNLPTGWQLSINGGNEDIPISSLATLSVPISVTAVGSSAIGSSFTVSLTAAEHIDLVNTTAEEPLHPTFDEIGGFDFTVNVLADTSITCNAYIQSGRVSVVGTLDGFQGIHQAGTPLRAYAQLYDASGNPIALDDRASGDVGSNGVFRMNFSYYSPNKGDAVQVPKSARCLFPGTHLLASSGSQNLNVINTAPPTATIVPWFASQFHSNLALNMFWPPLLPFGDFTCAFGRCPVLIAGKHGRGARMIDANSTMLQSTAPINLNTNFTVATWARRTRNNTMETLVSHGNSFMTGQLFNMGFTSDNTFLCSTFNDELLSSRVINDRDWHHYACVVQGNQRLLYIDGILDASRTSVLPSYARNATMYVGRRIDIARAFDGTLDEVLVYPFNLNATQIGQLFTLDPNLAAVPTTGMSFNDVVIAETNGVFSYCSNLNCPKVYYPDIYYPDTDGNPTPTTVPATTFNRPHERFAAFYMEPNHFMSYGMAPNATMTPYPGTDGSLMFWARLDDASMVNYPLVQSQTSPPVTRPSVFWRGSTRTLTFANLSVVWSNFDNGWHLFTFVKRGNMLEIYIDNNRVAEGLAPAGLQPFRVASGSTLNMGAVAGGEMAAVEFSPFAYPNDYIAWRYGNGIPNPATAQPSITPVSTLTPSRTMTFTRTLTTSRTPTGTFSGPTRTAFKLTAIDPFLTAVAATSQAGDFIIKNPIFATATAQALSINLTATNVQRTQAAQFNMTATAEARFQLTETAQIRATRSGTAVRTNTRFIIIPPTVIIIGFPTLFPSNTSTRTADPKISATSTRTMTATRPFTSTRTNTRSLTSTSTRPPSRTKISTPTFVTMTATITMSPTAISATFGPDAIPISRLPDGMLARALQFINDQRLLSCQASGGSTVVGCPATDWQDPIINDLAIPMYRPDISGGTLPAYYELSLTDSVSKQPRGYIVLAMDYGKNPQCMTSGAESCGIVDYPIPHWNSSGASLSSQITASSNSARTFRNAIPIKIWKLDTLSYVATQDLVQVSSLGAFPVLPDGLNNAFPQYSGDTGYGCNTLESDTPDDTMDIISPTDLVDCGNVRDADAAKSWKFQGLDASNNFKDYLANYPFEFAPLLQQLKEQAAKSWRYERAVIDPYISGDYSDAQTAAGKRFHLPIQEYTSVRVVLPFRGLTQANIRNDTPPSVNGSASVFSYELDTPLAGYSVLKVSANSSMPDDDLPRLRLSIVDASTVLAKVTLFMTEKSTQTCPIDGECPTTVKALGANRSWSAFREFYAGLPTDQRNYDQFAVSSNCLSGCGATAWMMLFGWVDFKSSPPPSYTETSAPFPRRWLAYRAGGQPTGNPIGATGTAPLTMDTGIRNSVLYIRNRVGTFCPVGSNSGATVPWDMDEAVHYLRYMGTGMGLDTHYNIVGASEDRFYRLALQHLADRNPRPVVIGTGWLAHYPLAWGMRYQQRPERWNEGWFDGDDVVWNTYWLVNQGWGGRGNGWVQGGVWFVGRVFP